LLALFRIYEDEPLFPEIPRDLATSIPKGLSPKYPKDVTQHQVGRQDPLKQNSHTKICPSSQDLADYVA
jgi:hypothetical protein